MSAAASVDDAPPRVAALSGQAARVDGASGEASATDGPSLDPGAVTSDVRCPGDMISVEGTYCPAVAHRCAEFVGDRGEEREGQRWRHEERRCRRFQNERICEGRPARLRYCIDRFEYPNREGAMPATMVGYDEAREACGVEGKRLCEAEEWAFACEGARTAPYPTGLERDASACNIDRPRRPQRLVDAHDREAQARQAVLLDQRVPSGSSPRCTSPFGGADMTGNVAEWVHYRRGRKGTVPSDAALAGGDWERTPALCRSLDASHDRTHRAHVSGFRCCADVTTGAAARVLMPAGARLEKRRAIVP